MSALGVLGWMAGGSATSWVVASLLAGGPAREILLGMIGPLAVASVTLVMTERTYRRDPEHLTALMLKAFAVKMLWFGAYVTIALTVLGLRPVPFIASFTTYFVALHLMEAVWLRTLFMSQAPASH